MISKRFYYILVTKVLLICLSALGMGYFFSEKNYILTSLFGLFIFFQANLLVRFFNSSNKKIAYFFKAMLNEDFTIEFPETRGISSVKELHANLNKLNTKFQSTHLHNQTQERYYQELIKQAEIGVLTINTEGHILFANPRAEKLLNHKPLTHIKQIHKISASLYELLSNTLNFNRKLIQINNERESVQLAIKANTIQLNGKQLKLITLQDINSELDTKETDSWIKLIRVLTHEMMNSIAPITSISESLLKQHQQNKVSEGETNQNDLNSVDIMGKGLQIIKNQGDDLIRFVQSYRNFLNVPNPEKKLIPVKTLFEKIEMLFENQLQQTNVLLTIDAPNDLTIFADEQQITQVLLNLVKNAIHSVQEKQNPKIELSAGLNHESKKILSITDNGVGITDEEMERIFVPFYTTKINGSGVGLSISKQIIQLHGGHLKVQSSVKNGTVFSIIF
ncbi:sensor histidine kinase [Aquimarina agarivorans]|uniref:sensor histidine kinase n=1 Tax=Aquimarina agarivorans TaxID=980584 RepID=UPI000248FD38|nr:ATP-binding protein [Aquimarina agarivorans]